MYRMYSDSPVVRNSAEEREETIQALERRIALGLATPERTQRRIKALERLQQQRKAQDD